MDFETVFTLRTLHWPVRNVKGTIAAISIAVLIVGLRIARAERRQDRGSPEEPG